MRIQEWLLRLFLWDGMAPAVVVMTAPICTLLFPGRPGFGELASIVVPIGAYLVRYVVGRKYFLEHAHYRWQVAVFFVAIFVLTLFDGFLILFRLNERVAPPNWTPFLYVYGVYLMMMATAFYPFLDGKEDAELQRAMADWTNRP
jgi:hypothetical protein